MYWKFLTKIERERKDVNDKNAKTHKKIPPKVLKTSAMVTAETLQHLFHQALNTGKFPSNLKFAVVRPVFKKNNPKLHQKNVYIKSVFVTIPMFLQKGF